ncbi:MAG: hypothetical protein AAFY10_01360 [Pseudomonadota bacterium]
MGLKPDRPGGLTSWLLAGALAALAPLALGACGQGTDTEYVSSWGPSIGTEAPLLAANDQDGNAQSLETLAGPNGLLVVFNRSVNW